MSPAGATPRPTSRGRSRCGNAGPSLTRSRCRERGRAVLHACVLAIRCVQLTPENLERKEEQPLSSDPVVDGRSPVPDHVTAKDPCRRIGRRVPGLRDPPGEPDRVVQMHLRAARDELRPRRCDARHDPLPELGKQWSLPFVPHQRHARHETTCRPALGGSPARSQAAREGSGLSNADRERPAALPPRRASAGNRAHGGAGPAAGSPGLQTRPGPEAGPHRPERPGARGTHNRPSGPS